MATHWVIDWERVQTVEDIKLLLQCAEMCPRPEHPLFDEIKNYCKQIDDDGKEIDGNP